MTKYILKRIGISLIVLLGITVIDFLIMTMAGNPIEILSGGPRINQAALAQRAENLGLNKPVIVQYFSWLKSVLHGDFGFSYRSYESVSSMIMSHLKPTLVLMGSALLFSTLIAVALGIVSALYTRRAADYIIQALAFLGQSVPQFFLALILIYVFSVRSGILPSGGMGTLTSSGETLELKNLVLPMLVLAFTMAGRNIRYIRSSMLEILNKEYLRTAKAKGIGRFRVVMKHALRNALVPVITVLAMEIPVMVGGSVIVEQIFSWPGLGQMTMSAVLARDYPVVMAVCLLSAVTVLFTNVLTDILYALVDPGVRFE